MTADSRDKPENDGRALGSSAVIDGGAGDFPDGEKGRAHPATSHWLMLAALMTFFAVPASAQTLDITVPYGNEAGCKVVKGEGEKSDEALIVRSDRFEASSSTCTFVQVLTAPDATKVVTALCDIEGEEGRSINHFTVSPGKDDPSVLTIHDEYGAPWDEVKPCS